MTDTEPSIGNQLDHLVTKCKELSPTECVQAYRALLEELPIKLILLSEKFREGETAKEKSSEEQQQFTGEFVAMLGDVKIELCLAIALNEAGVERVCKEHAEEKHD